MRPRTIVLTSTFLRHDYVVNRVAKELDVLGVWREEKSFKPAQFGTSHHDHVTIAEHFERRDESEELFFARDRVLRLPASAIIRTCPPGYVNDAAEIELMATLEPQLVLVFGTGILKDTIIERFAGRIINLHLGLSPYYRGAGTNFWPLVNREPEYVGATIHYLDAGIDTGPIIAHARPSIDPADGPHTLGNKAIIAAATTLVAAGRLHVAGRVSATPQAGPGRLYYRKHFNAEAVEQLYENFRTGMIAEYLEEKARRDAPVLLRELPE